MCPTGVTSSEWPQREACTRFEHSCVARPPNELDFTFLNAVSARPWDGPKSAKDVRVVLPDVSSLAAIAEAEGIGKTRRLYINKADITKHGLTEGCLGAVPSQKGNERKDTPKDAVHDSKLKSPRRTRRESA